MRWTALVAAMVVLAAACSSPATEDSGTTEPGNGIEAVEIDGVWVFQHEPEVGMDALHSGTPEIVNGCLMVDGAIVVWPAELIEDAAAAVAAARAGSGESVLIGGGGMGQDEGLDPSQIPTVISDRCAVNAIWFGSP